MLWHTKRVLFASAYFDPKKYMYFEAEIYNSLSYVNFLFSAEAAIRVHPRFFDQVGHQITNASIGNKYFFTK